MLGMFSVAKLGFIQFPFFCTLSVGVWSERAAHITMPHRLLEESVHTTDVALFYFIFSELPVIAKR